MTKKKRAPTKKRRKPNTGQFKPGGRPGPGRPAKKVAVYKRDGVLRPRDVEALAEEGAEREDVIPYLHLDRTIMADLEALTAFDRAYRDGSAARAIWLVRQENKKIKDGSVQALIKALEASIARYQERPTIVDESGLVVRVEALFHKLERHQAGIRDGMPEEGKQ